MQPLRGETCVQHAVMGAAKKRKLLHAAHAREPPLCHWISIRPGVRASLTSGAGGALFWRHTYERQHPVNT